MTSLFSVGGLASGLDTEGIVRQLMQIERIPVNQIQTRQAALRRTDGAWSGVVTALSGVRSALGALDRAGDYDTHVAIASSSTAVTATRTGAPTTGNIAFTVTQLAQSYQGTLSGSTTLRSADDAVGAGTLRIRHADEADFAEIDTTGLTLGQVAAQINAATNLDVSASVQATSGGTVRLLLTSQRSGQDGGLVFDLASAPPELNSATELYAAQNATLTMGSGAGALEITSATNTVTGLIDGVTLQLQQPTATPVTISISRDPTVTVERVRALVDALNATISALRTQTGYDTESDKAGALQGDSTAVGLRFALSGAFTALVPNAAGLSAATAVGITVGRDGLLTLDEDTLSNALATDFDGVVTLLTAPSAPAEGEPGPGVLTSLDAVLDGYEGAAGQIALTRQGISDRITANDDQVDRYEVRLELRERLLRQKFAGLESTLATLQAQGSNLLAQLGTATR